MSFAALLSDETIAKAVNEIYISPESIWSKRGFSMEDGVNVSLSENVLETITSFLRTDLDVREAYFYGSKDGKIYEFNCVVEVDQIQRDSFKVYVSECIYKDLNSSRKTIQLPAFERIEVRLKQEASGQVKTAFKHLE
jgi:hypothetical protein